MGLRRNDVELIGRRKISTRLLLSCRTHANWLYIAYLLLQLFLPLLFVVERKFLSQKVTRFKWMSFYGPDHLVSCLNHLFNAICYYFYDYYKGKVHVKQL